MKDDKLTPLAMELIGSVRDYGPDTVAEILARVPAKRRDDLTVLLARMVDPDKSPAQLLEWMNKPVKSRGFTPSVFFVKKLKREAGGALHAERRAEVARLWVLGLSVSEIAERMGLTERSVTRHRQALRAAAEKEAA